MINKIKSVLFIFLAIIIGFISCKKEDKTFGELTSPSKPVIDVKVAGKTAANPDGDGTGKVTVTVTSANAINYKIDFGDGSTPATGTVNSAEHIYSHIGSKTVTVSVIASGKAGIASTGNVTFSVRKDYIPTAELVTMLTNDATKTWKVDSAQAGNIGVGPATSRVPEWYTAGPNEKSGLGLYDDEYTFTKAGNVFAHKTNNTIFGKKEFLTDFDPSLTGAGDFTLTGTPAANYTEQYSYDGVGGAEYIIFTMKGHMGLYVGAHKYEVLTKTATQMWLRCIGNDGNAWYVKIKAK